MTITTAGSLHQLAVATLDNNWQGDHMVPSRRLYPHQWSWDAGFIAIGLAHVDPARAWRDLHTLFDAQWSDGRVPHIVFNEGDSLRGYFPGPDFWRSVAAPGAPGRATSGMVQPPVHALAAWEIYQRTSEPIARAESVAQLARLYPKLVHQQRYLMACRNIGSAGLAAIVHPWESGQDNSPAWDEAMAAVPANLERLSRYQRRDLAVSVASHRPTDADYSRYIAIAQGYRSYGYVDDGPGGRYLFLMECPTFNTLLAAAEHALADIATVIGADPQPHRKTAEQLTKALVARLFNPATGMFHSRDLYTGRLSQARGIGGLIPLILPDLPREYVERLVAEASTPRFGLGPQMALPLPSYDRTAPELDPVRYWRGPIWVNMNWLLWQGLRRHGFTDLAAALRETTLAMIARSGCYEYFHTHTGEGVGAAEFSWTAALALDLLTDPVGLQ